MYAVLAIQHATIYYYYLVFMLLDRRVGTSLSFHISARMAIESKAKDRNVPADQEHSGLSQRGRTCPQIKLLNGQTWRQPSTCESLYGTAKTIRLDLSALEVGQYKSTATLWYSSTQLPLRQGQFWG